MTVVCAPVLYIAAYIFSRTDRKKKSPGFVFWSSLCYTSLAYLVQLLLNQPMPKPEYTRNTNFHTYKKQLIISVMNFLKQHNFQTTKFSCCFLIISFFLCAIGFRSSSSLSLFCLCSFLASFTLWEREKNTFFVAQHKEK